MSSKVVKSFLASQKWAFTQVKNKDIFLFGITGETGSFQCTVQVDEEDKKILFVSICGSNTPAEKKTTMLELLNGFNYELFFGNFEMGLEDGEVRFRTSISYKHFELNEDAVGEIIMSNIQTMDKCMSYILKTMYSEVKVSDVLADFKI